MTNRYLKMGKNDPLNRMNAIVISHYLLFCHYRRAGEKSQTLRSMELKSIGSRPDFYFDSPYLVTLFPFGLGL